jgi:hypothetical protein
MPTKYWSEYLKGRDPLGKPRRMSEDIRVDLRETIWEGVEWIQLAQYRDQWRVLANTVTNFLVPERQRISRLGQYQLLKNDSAPWSYTLQSSVNKARLQYKPTMRNQVAGISCPKEITVWIIKGNLQEIGDRNIIRITDHALSPTV